MKKFSTVVSSAQIRKADVMKSAINHAMVFSGFRKIFGVRSYSMVDKLYDIPSDKWDDCETDMIRDIWSTMDHMCNVKQKMQ